MHPSHWRLTVRRPGRTSRKVIRYAHRMKKTVKGGEAKGAVQFESLARISGRPAEIGTAALLDCRLGPSSSVPFRAGAAEAARLER